MLNDLRRLLGDAAATAYALRVSVRTVEGWRLRPKFSDSARSLIHFAWCLYLHPEKAETIYDLETWGRFRPLRTHSRKESFRAVAQERLTDGAGI